MHHVGNTSKTVATMVFKDDKVLVEIKGRIMTDISLKGVYSKE
jgi:hypothetical protein